MRFNNFVYVSAIGLVTYGCNNEMGKFGMIKSEKEIENNEEDHNMLTEIVTKEKLPFKTCPQSELPSSYKLLCEEFYTHVKDSDLKKGNISYL